MSSYTQLSHKCFELVANSNLSNKLWISFPLSLSQIVTVVFYIFTDLILISQFLYYKIKNSSSRSKPWFISSLEFKWKTVEWRLWCVSHNYSMILHMNENLKLWGRRYFLLLTQWLCSCLHCQFFVLCVCVSSREPRVEVAVFHVVWRCDISPPGFTQAHHRQ